MTNVGSITVTIPNPTIKQLSAIVDILNANEGTITSVKTGGTLARLAKTNQAPTKRTAPAKTVSGDEDEDFATEALDEDEVMETTSDDPADWSEEETEEEEEGIDFATVKAAINKYGEKHPKEMTAIYAGFNLKNTKELEKNPKKWEAVYNKVNAKLKAAKKAK